MNLRFLLSFYLIGMLVMIPTWLMAQVRVNSIDQLAAPAGTLITIQGSGFNLTATRNIVRFGAANGAVQTATSNLLTVFVPQGASYAPVDVLNIETHFSAKSSKYFLPTFPPGASSIGPGDFGPARHYFTAAGPVSLVLSDLDNDGLVDMAVGTSISDVVTIRRNISAGGIIDFAPIQNFAVGRTPSGITAADLDGDGLPELVTANMNSNTASFLLNTSTPGNISFSRREVNLGRTSGAVTITDYDHDGKPDVAVMTHDAIVSVFRNTSSPGNLTFSAKIDFAVGYMASDIASADIDGDGSSDLITGNFSGSVTVLRNISSPGNISFATQTNFYVEGDPRSVTVGDFDADGKIDIAVPHYRGISVLRNISITGVVNMAPVTVLEGSDGGFDITAADIDGDGRPDFATANWMAHFTERVTVFKNTSVPGNMSQQAKVPLISGRGPFAIALNDLDGDSRPEIVVANNNDESVTIFPNRPRNRPALQATNLRFTSVTSISASINWNSGNGSSRAVFMKVNGNAGAPVPVDGTTYNSDNIFGSGAQIGNSGWYCIYKGTGNQTSVTGLSPGTEYQVMVCEMNGNPANELYLSEAAQGNPGNFTTVSNDARLQTLGLSPFSLEPNFDPGVINYTATTTVSQPNVILTPVVKMPGSTITLNGNPVVNGSQTDLPLATGNNQIRIIVTAPDRITTKIYTIQILRRKSDQIITFNTLADKRVCDQEFDPGAVSNSGLPIVYTTSNPAVAMILPDGRIGITGAGRVTISANQPGNNNFNAAAPKIQTLTVNSLLVPTIRVTSSATGSVCTGVQITFTAVTTAGGSNPAYSWKVNGQPAGTGLSTFSSSSLEDGDLVSCTLTSTGDPCISSVPVNSTGVRVVISAPAQIGVTILASENPVTSGLPVTFRATSSGAVGLRHYRWRVNANIRGTDADRFTLSNPVEGDVITCELSTEAPCDVPVMSNNIILQVREEVKTVIPTTFSPNGDGINDYWRIRLHSNDRIHLSIFNRLGVIVYQSDAIEVSWDGSYKGKLLMPGTYYFVLTFAGSDKRLTGPVTLLY